MNSARLRALRAGGLTRAILRRTLVLANLVSILALALIVSTDQLERMSERRYLDALTLEISHELEISILAHRRNTLLYLVRQDSSYLQANDSLLLTADGIVGQLPGRASSAEEARVAARITELYGKFRAAVALNPGRPTEETQTVIGSLVMTIARLRAINNEHLQATRQASAELNRNINRASIVLLPLFIGLLLFFAYQFWLRLFRPLVVIAEATRQFGEGDSSARVPVNGRAELTGLAETFNTMADAIVAREQERRHLVAAVAHDLRSPLTAILGYSELLPQLAAGEQADCLARLALQCRRLDGMTRDLMDSIRVETGNMTIQARPVELAALLRECVAEARALNPGRQISLDLPGACRVSGDELRLQRVVHNLLSNALKYSPPGTEISVALAIADGGARLTISDQGPGMTAEEQARLFQPFSRLARTARSTPGTGLGLYSVRKIIEAHAGELHLDSIPGVGTTLTVDLPVLPD